MTCKFCGSYLDEDATECPYCGHPTELFTETLAAEEPENDLDVDLNEIDLGDIAPGEYEDYTEPEDGYDDYAEPADSSASGKSSKLADMASRFGAKASSAISSAKASAASKKSSSNRSSSRSSSGASAANPNVIMLGAIALCFLFVLISMFVTISSKNKVDDMYQDMLSQFYQLQNDYNQLSDQISDLNTVATTTANTAAQTQAAIMVNSNITITKQPSECSTYVGRTGNVPIFTVSAEGTSLGFSWQKYNSSTGTWEDLVFDDSSNNATYGLHVYTDSGQGYSELAANNVTSAAFGSYRCIIADSTGYTESDTVILSERAA